MKFLGYKPSDTHVALGIVRDGGGGLDLKIETHCNAAGPGRQSVESKGLRRRTASNIIDEWTRATARSTLAVRVVDLRGSLLQPQHLPHSRFPAPPTHLQDLENCHFGQPGPHNENDEESLNLITATLQEGSRPDDAAGGNLGYPIRTTRGEKKRLVELFRPWPV